MNQENASVLITKEDIPQTYEIGYSYWYENGVYPKGVLKNIIKDKISYGIKIKNELIVFSIMK